MKRTIACCLILLSASVLFAQTPLAVLREVTGTVEIRSSPSSPWTPATRGLTLRKDMTISTGFKSTAVISLGGSVMTVRPLTRVSVEELTRRDDTEQVQVYLTTGRVRAEVNAPPESRVDFSVRGPSATASVRGTEFEFDNMNLRVTQGSVEFAGRGGPAVAVGSGQSSKIDSYGGASSPAGRGGQDLTPPLPFGAEAVIGGPATGSKPDLKPPATGNVSITIGWE